MQFLRLLIYTESTIPIFRKGERCFCSRVISEDVIMKATARLRGVQLHHLLYIIIYCPFKGNFTKFEKVYIQYLEAH